MNLRRTVLLTHFFVVLVTAAPSGAQVTDNAATFHVFPQVADGRLPGGGFYRSTLLVANPSDTASSTCTLQLYGLQANFPDLGLGKADIFRFTLDKDQWRIASSQAVLDFAQGYATLTCDRPVTAQILYSSYTGSTKVAEATVFSSPGGKIVQLLADHREGGSLGIAVANNTDRTVSYTITAADASGTVIGSSTINVNARSNSARFVDEIIRGIPKDFRGQIFIASVDGSNVYAIGLKFTAYAFTTIPTTLRPSATPGGGNPTNPTSTPSVLVTRAYTSDTNNVERASFSFGQTVRFKMDRLNNLSSETTVQARYQVTGPGAYLLTDSNVPASATPAGRSSFYLEVPIPQNAPTGTYTYEASVTYNGVTSSSSANFTVGEKSFNQTQAERLFGTWTFTYTASMSSTSTYRLNDVEPSPVTPGDWGIFGTNATGNLVLATYSSSLGRFILVDPGTVFDQAYVFDFNGPNTVAGQAFQISPPGSTNLGNPYPMTGVRTSSSAMTSLSTENGQLDRKGSTSDEESQSADANLVQALETIRLAHRWKSSEFR